MHTPISSCRDLRHEILAARHSEQVPTLLARRFSVVYQVVAPLDAVSLSPLLGQDLTLLKNILPAL